MIISLLLIIPSLNIHGREPALILPESYFGFQPGSDGNLFNYQDLVIPLAQPFSAFIREVMEVQEFPERHDLDTERYRSAGAVWI